MGEKRDAYVSKMKDQLDKWNVEINKLEEKARKASADARMKYQKQIEALKAKGKELDSRLEALGKAGDAAMQDMKAGLDKAWKALGDAVKDAKTRFK